MSNIAKTYVYNGDEVVHTGRKAVRARTGRKPEEMWEITPVVAVGSTNAGWRKWVFQDELFEVSDEGNAADE